MYLNNMLNSYHKITKEALKNNTLICFIDNKKNW